MLSQNPPPLRILTFCTEFGVGGISRHALELGRWLRARGHEVAFAGTPGPWLDPDKEAAFVAVDSRGVSDREGGAGLPGRLASLAQSAAKLRSSLRAHPVDLIHAHESAPALIARLASLGLNIPIVLTFHGAEKERMGQYAAIANFAATRIISVSERGAADLREAGVRARKLTSIGLGVKPLKPVDPARAAQLRRELLGADGRFLVVTIARFTYQKGIDRLIEVAKKIAPVRPDIRFVVVGDGPLEDEMRREAEEAGVTDRLFFAGRSEEPGLYLSASDLFLLTSRWEALPFTIVEAFQTGTPAVATNCSGVPELIDDAVGRVAPVDDMDAIVRHVLDIAGDETMRAAMASAAAARALEDRFKPEAVHARIEALYYDVLKAKAR